MKKIVTLVVLLLSSAAYSYAAIGWVGNIHPSGTNNSSSGSGGSFNYDVYIQVYKSGVTEPGGQGAGITCEIYWSGGVVSPYPGGSWPSTGTISMTYNTDIGNNDEYKGTITVTNNGGYEYTARCSDDGGSTYTWNSSGNGGFNLTGLPISLASFTGTSNEDKATLNWVTVSELNSDHFDVEHSANGSAWKKVGTVQAAGNSIDLRNYSYTVEGLQVGTHSFRLKSVDKNGDARYTASVQLNVEVPGQYVLYPAYPNPFNPTTTITFAVATRQAVKAEVFNALGQKVRTLFNGTLEANVPHIAKFDAAGLQSGMYLVRVTGANFKATQNVTLLK